MSMTGGRPINSLAEAERGGEPHPPVKRRRRSPEKVTQWRIIKALRDLGFFVVSLSQPQRAMMTAGVPDLFVAHRRWGSAWIEVKPPTRRGHKRGGLTIDQVQWHASARESGVRVFTAYSVEDVVRELDIGSSPSRSREP